jgi:hypothetical protein
MSEHSTQHENGGTSCGGWTRATPLISRPPDCSRSRLAMKRWLIFATRKRLGHVPPWPLLRHGDAKSTLSSREAASTALRRTPSDAAGSKTGVHTLTVLQGTCAPTPIGLKADQLVMPRSRSRPPRKWIKNRRIRVPAFELLTQGAPPRSPDTILHARLSSYNLDSSLHATRSYILHQDGEQRPSSTPQRYVQRVPR